MCKTNTIVIYDVNKTYLQTLPPQLNSLSLEGLEQCHAISFLRRLVLQFHSAHYAAQAEPSIKTLVEQIPGAHYGYTLNDNVSCNHFNEHLKLPDPGTLWLISPPPSPPAEWQPSTEEKPNDKVHFEEELNARLMQHTKIDTRIPKEPIPTYPSPCAYFPKTIMIMEAQQNTPALKLTQE